MEFLVNKGKLNRMCKYFRGKSVRIFYRYNNSLGHTDATEYYGRYDRFELKEQVYTYWDKYYTIRFYRKNQCIFEQCFGSHAEFCGVGKIRECNSGPYCYFSIRKTYSVIGLLIHKIKRICRGKRKK